MATEPYTPDAPRWDAFVKWARRFYEWDGFDEAERDYKITAGEQLAAVREGFLNNSPDWRSKLHDVASQPYLLYWGATTALRGFLESDEAGSASALLSVWAPGDATPRERVRAFAQAVDIAGADIRGRDNLGSFLLMALDPAQHPYYQYKPFNAAYQMTGYPRVSNRAPAEDKYGQGLDFVDELMRQAKDRGLDVRDRLDAQSLVWCVTKQDYFVDEWPSDVREALQRYRQSDGAAPRNSSAHPGEPDWASVADGLTWDRHSLGELVADFEDKKQMIFYGPPGTGKTFVARAIAAEYKRVGGDFEIVQFHPSYSYEDFVEGFRPSSLDDGQARFELVSGPLKRIAAAAAKKATEQPGAKFVLVIDELNRGNVAKVFGELYFLLEYRDEAINLQYGREPFRLPDNLLFICTMNTADRSIALVDSALRRRFWFEGFFPDQPPIQGLLRRWLRDRQPGAEWVADLVDCANQHLGDRDAAIGPSYFMGDETELDDDRVKRIWRRAVLPYVEEQCYGEADKLAALRYDRLRSELADAEPLPVDPQAGGEDAAADSSPDSDEDEPS